MSERENRDPRVYVAAKEELSLDEDLRVLISPIDHPICLAMPKRLTPYSFWHEHIPFAMYLVDISKPGMIVELGTQYGDSYCAFCQAVKEPRLDTRCYAIDTWQGDLHVGAYGPAVLADLRGHHDPLYGSFSTLIASSFEEALPHFADGTIDILHIDGYHTYEAVKGDFESWLRKVSSRGVILLHDTNVRKGDFGVRRFWDEIQSEYAHFEFLHGSGLGIVAMQQVSCKELRAFFDASDERAETIRDLFFQLGHRLAMEVKAAVLESELRQHQGHLHRIMNSRSWRLTEPLRRLASALRCIRGRARARSDGITRPPQPLE